MCCNIDLTVFQILGIKKNPPRNTTTENTSYIAINISTTCKYTSKKLLRH